MPNSTELAHHVALERMALLTVWSFTLMLTRHFALQDPVEDGDFVEVAQLDVATTYYLASLSYETVLVLVELGPRFWYRKLLNKSTSIPRERPCVPAACRFFSPRMSAFLPTVTV